MNPQNVLSSVSRYPACDLWPTGGRNLGKDGTENDKHVAGKGYNKDLTTLEIQEIARARNPPCRIAVKYSKTGQWYLKDNVAITNEKLENLIQTAKTIGKYEKRTLYYIKYREIE